MTPRAEDLACLASSLLADETPPPRVHDAWRGAADAAPGTGAGAVTAIADHARRRAGRFITFAAAAAVTFIAATGASFLGSGADRGITASESGGGEHPDGEGPVEAEVELASVAPAVGGAMGERNLSALRDPAALEECLAGHGESAGALLGAAPVTVEGRVRQLFVLATGIPGRVSVLVVTEGCGSEPGPPLVHDTIGAPR